MMQPSRAVVLLIAACMVYVVHASFEVELAGVKVRFRHDVMSCTSNQAAADTSGACTR